MGTIGWNESSPPDTQSAGLGDDAIRSLTTSIRVGMETEHVWPSAGGAAGVHRLGSGRAYFGPQSTVSSSGTDGKLMISSDISHLFGVGSGGTVFFGGPRVISAAYHPSGTAPSRHQWAEEFGLAVIPSGLTLIAVTIPNSGFSGIPYTTMTQVASGGGFDVTTAGITALTATSFTIYGTGSSGYTFCWRSLGTRAL